MGDLQFELSPTQLEFVTCESQIVQLMGGMASGKSFAGVVGLIAHAERCQKDIRCALIRDTFTNIKTSTVPDIKDYLGQWARFTDGEKKLVIDSSPKVTCDLFGIDDHASMSKLQGPQYACVWLEEPAPIIERANAGLPKQVLDLAIARASRQRDTKMRVQVTQNPADEYHWTSQLAEEPEDYLVYTNPDTGNIVVIKKSTFWMQASENKFLSDETRAATIAAFKDDPAKYARYVEGQIASVNIGKKVCPAYNSTIHYSDRVLEVNKGEVIQFWDGWQSPCCILTQYANNGQLLIHDVVQGDRVGVVELIREDLSRLINSPKYKGKIESWRIIGDPSMATPDQSSIRNVTSKVIEEHFNARFERGTMHWKLRKEPLNQCFKTLIQDGIPAVYLSKSALLLHRALRGGWHYKMDNSGNIIGDQPEKNEMSHAGDAFSYGVSVLMPYATRDRLNKIGNLRDKDKMKYAMSYRGGNYSRPKRAAMGL